MNERESFFLELKNIEITVEKRILLKEAHFSLRKGEWALLLGSNGSGKTTLLKLLAGRWSSWKGSIIINNKEYNSSTWNSFKAYENGIILLDQLPNLPSHLKVWEYLSWGLKEGINPFHLNLSSFSSFIKNKIESDFFSSLSLESQLKDLKQGDLFKVSILSAVLRAKNLILWDESTIFLNVQEKESLFSLIESLKENGLSHLMVTHDRLIFENKRLKKLFIDHSSLSLKNEIKNDFFSSEFILPKKKPSMNPIFTVSLEKFSLEVGKGEIVALISQQENFLREIEDTIMGNISLKKGESLILESQDISSLNFSQRRKRIGYVKAWLGIREEPAFYSLLFRFIFSNKDLFIKEEDLIFRAKEMVPPYFYRRLLTPWKFLSGGEKQSLILEREISNRPSFILVPFPFQGLDQKSISSFTQKLKKFSHLGGVLILTTELQEVSYIADRFISLENV